MPLDGGRESEGLKILRIFGTMLNSYQRDEMFYLRSNSTDSW